ncbi:MAG: hypothetical protein ACK4TP_05020 [Hyphomicrobium sp.]
MGILSYPLRHWRGDYSLWLSFWISFVLLFAAAVAGFYYILGNLGDDFEPVTGIRVIVGGLLALCTLFVWQSVGVWRSAKRRRQAGGGRIVSFLAVAGLLAGLTAIVLNVAVARPMLNMLGEIAAGRDAISRAGYRIALGSDRVIIYGAITYGVDRKLSDILDARPSIRLVQLESTGGHRGAGLRLARVILGRGLDTTTMHSCSSACTFAFLAGRERSLGPKAKLGFHSAGMRYAPKGLDERAMLAATKRAQASMQRFYAERGLPAAFIDRVLATPDQTMWFPSREELLQAGVITTQEAGKSPEPASAANAAANTARFSDENSAASIKEGRQR